MKLHISKRYHSFQKILRSVTFKKHFKLLRILRAVTWIPKIYEFAADSGFFYIPKGHYTKHSTVPRILQDKKFKYQMQKIFSFPSMISEDAFSFRTPKTQPPLTQN